MGKRFGKSTSVGIGVNSNLILKIVTPIGEENKKTRTIRITEKLYERFSQHSRRYYNIETYETILQDLLDCYEKHNQDKHWWTNNNDGSNNTT